MTELVRERCVACNRDAPRVSEQELAELRPQIPEWQLLDVDGVPRLQRTYRLRDFAAALDLTNRIGTLAEEEQHHQAITTEWGRVTVAWWTHKIRGLHRNDLIMAARTDTIAHEAGAA